LSLSTQCRCIAGVEVYLHKFLTWSLCGDEWPTSRPSRFTLGKVYQYSLNRRLGAPPEMICIGGRGKSLALAAIRTTVRTDRGPVTIPTTKSVLLTHPSTLARHVSAIKAQIHISNEFDKHKAMAFNTGVTSGWGVQMTLQCFFKQRTLFWLPS